jgi:uncharacterized membrane protein (UPF0127 family)
LLRDGRVWVARVDVAASLTARMRGLLGRPAPASGSGLLIERCGSVHTVGMRCPLDLVFLDRQWRVTRIVRNVPPGCCCVWGGWRAARVLEVAAGWLDVAGVTPGAVLVWRETLQ